MATTLMGLSSGNWCVAGRARGGTWPHRARGAVGEALTGGLTEQAVNHSVDSGGNGRVQVTEEGRGGSDVLHGKPDEAGAGVGAPARQQIEEHDAERVHV